MALLQGSAVANSRIRALAQQTTAFRQGDCRRAENMEVDVRNTRMPLFEKGGSQMASAIYANGICTPRKRHLRWSQMAFAAHHLRTSTFSISEHRRSPSRHIGNHAFRRQAAGCKHTDRNRQKNTTSRGGLWYLGEWYPRGYFENIIFSLLNILANTYENATA